MSFSSIPFLCFFLPITLSVYYLCPKKHKNFILTVASLIFVAFGEPKFLFVLLFSSVISYLSGIAFDVYRNNPKKCRFVFCLSLVLNLALPVVFKYSNSVLHGFGSAFLSDITYASLEMASISFFALRAVSYTADAYTGNIKAQTGFADFLCYMSMFPLSVAGPLVRYNDIADELSKRTLSLSKCGEGVGDFIKGLSKKVILADNIGILYSKVVLSDYSDLSVLGAWLGIIAFFFQVYYSFSGYSDMAVGLGKMLGFTFSKNFQRPLSSKSIFEFWSKWHISFGVWLQTYVYNPLGADKKGKIRKAFNIIIVWLVAAIWHGARFNYVLWGLYFALLMLAECFAGKAISEKVPKTLRVVGTNVLVLLGCVLIESKTPKNAWTYFCAMLGANHMLFDTQSVYSLRIYALTLLICFVFASSIYQRCVQYVRSKKKLFSCALAITPLVQTALLIICMAYLVNNPDNSFLYM